MIANISTDEIIEKIAIFKQRDDLDKANKAKSEKDKIRELSGEILERGVEVKNMLKICNFLISNGYCHKSLCDYNEIIIEINRVWLLDVHHLQVYSLTNGSSDTYAYSIGNDNIKTTGDRVIIGESLGKENAGALIKHLERFASNLDETLKAFYKNLGKQLGVDLLTVIQ